MIKTQKMYKAYQQLETKEIFFHRMPFYATFFIQCIFYQTASQKQKKIVFLYLTTDYKSPKKKLSKRNKHYIQTN